MDWEYRFLHPELIEITTDFDKYSEDNGFPPLVFTDMVRDEETNVVIYVAHWKRIVMQLKTNPKSLSTTDLDKAKELRFHSDAQLVALAKKRFTWHWCRCAVDMRSRHYSPAERLKAIDFFKIRCGPNILNPDGSRRWEFLVHDVHGPHFHLARRDPVWRQKFTGNPLPTKGKA
jgi:hypothetical protein